MLERLSKTHRNIALALIGALLVWFAWTVRSVLNPLILGYLFAYILRPMVQKLQDRGMGRRSAVNIIFMAFAVLMLLVFGATFIQGRQFVENQIVHVKEGDDLFTRAEANINRLLGNGDRWMDKTFRSQAADDLREGAQEPASDDSSSEAVPEAVPEVVPQERPLEVTPEASVEEAPVEATDPGGGPPALPAEDPAEEAMAATDDAADAEDSVEDEGVTLRNLLRAWSATLVGSSDGGTTGFDRAQIVLGYLQRIFGGLMSVLAFLALLPVYTYFLLFELERIHEFVRAHVPKRERERVTRIGRRVGAVIANFFRGRLLICLLKGLVLAIGLTVLQVPYGFLLGVVSGFLALVPFVGPLIGFGLTFLMSLQKASPDASGMWISLALLGGIFALAEIIEGYVFIPKILGDTLGLHPVVILLSVFVGGAALGLFGFLIAIPLAATLIILFRELVMPALADFAEEDSHTDDLSAVGEIPAPDSGA
jgi:predicted PurR-regulated permease PerM